MLHNHGARAEEVGFVPLCMEHAMSDLLWCESSLTRIVERPHTSKFCKALTIFEILLPKPCFL